VDSDWNLDLFVSPIITTYYTQKIASSGMLRFVALVGTDFSEDLSASFIRVFLLSVHRLLITASVPSSPILVTLMKEAPSSYETWVLTRATRRNIPEYAILHSHRRENLKSYILHSLEIASTACNWQLSWVPVVPTGSTLPDPTKRLGSRTKMKLFELELSHNRARSVHY
jgi:hypothetical protein